MIFLGEEKGTHNKTRNHNTQSNWLQFSFHVQSFGGLCIFCSPRLHLFDQNYSKNISLMANSIAWDRSCCSNKHFLLLSVVLLQIFV